MKRELVRIPKIKIHPTRIILYDEFNWFPYPPRRKIKDDPDNVIIEKEIDGKIQFIKVNRKFLNSKRVSDGTLSKQAQKKLKLSIEYFLMLNKTPGRGANKTARSYKNKIAFITLTLPSAQIHSDKLIKEKCLNQFMIELHKYHHITNYIWRAEYQKNGNIHFHILVNRFISWNEIRSRWNRIINKLGYVDKYRESIKLWHSKGFQVRKDLLKNWSAEKQYKAYLAGKKTDYSQPNSIDIHGIKNILNIKSYLIKYMSKNENDNNEYESEPSKVFGSPGRIWTASIILSKIKGASGEVDNQTQDNLDKLFKNSAIHKFEGDYFTIIDINVEDILKEGCTYLHSLFYSYMLQTFDYHYQYKF